MGFVGAKTAFLGVILSATPALATGHSFHPGGIPRPAPLRVRARSITVPAQAVVTYGSATTTMNSVARELGSDAPRTGDGELSLTVTPLSLRVTFRDRAGGAVRLTNFRPAPGGVRENATIPALPLAGGDSLAPGFTHLAVLGWADLVDARGERIAHDRAAAVFVTGTRAVVIVPGVSWDGRPEPVPGRAHGYLELAYDAVRLDDPSRDPTRLVEVDAQGARTPVGGAVTVAAVDAPGGDSVSHLTVDVARPDGRSLHVAGVVLDPRRGVIVDAPTQSLGRVRLALWGTCDVSDAAGQIVARRQRLRLWVGVEGDTHVDVEGQFRIVAGDGLQRFKDSAR